MDLLQSIILGLIQGTTEWLPISSTGHLRIAEYFFALSVPLLFDVILHVGTLFVTLVYFRGSIKNVVITIWHRDFRSEEGRLILPIIVGSIPTAIIALLWGNSLDRYFSSLIPLGIGFIITSVVLGATKVSAERKTTIKSSEAFVIGIIQGLTIIPSISRSGFTIAIAMLLGIKKEIAFKFSFLLSIPAIIGALGLTLYQEYSTFSLFEINSIYIATALAMTILISFFSLKVLWKALSAKKFHLFAIYCTIIGVLLIALSLLGF